MNIVFPDFDEPDEPENPNIISSDEELVNKALHDLTEQFKNYIYRYKPYIKESTFRIHCKPYLDRHDCHIKLIPVEVITEDGEVLASAEPDSERFHPAIDMIQAPFDEDI